MKNYIFLFLLAFSLVQGQGYSALTIPENLKKDAYVVIRDNVENYTIKSVDDIEIKKQRIWTILGKEGEDYGRIFIPYDKSSKVSDIKVTVYNALGKETKTYSKKDFSDYSNTPSYGLYVDNRILVLSINSTAFPFTIKLTYTENTSNSVFIEDFTGFGNFNISVEKATRTFNNLSGIPLRSKITNTDFGKVQSNESGNISTYTYSNIPAIREEDYSPSVAYLSPNVQFSLESFNLEGKKGDIKDWNTFGKWYYQNLLSPASAITPELKNEVDALQLSGSTEEKVKKLYQYMQGKTRYVFVAMGIGGWQPMTADEVRKKGYGDCKALTNYMRSMLDAAGIPSYYAVITSDTSPVNFDKNFPKMGGNHVILMVPDKDKKLWLENTSQTIAFNHLSYNTTNRNVLAVSENGAEIINTPIYSAEQSEEKLSAKVKLKEDNSVEGDALVKYTGGQYDFNMRLLALNQEERKELMRNQYWSLKFSEIEVNDLKNDKDKAEISYDLKFQAADYSKKLGNDIFFRVMPFTEFNLNTTDKDRKLPFEMAFAFQDDYTVEYEAPAGYHFSEIPKGNSLESEFGTYTIDFKEDNGKLLVHRVLRINKGIYPKEKYVAYLDFRKKTIGYDNIKILVSHN